MISSKESNEAPLNSDTELMLRTARGDESAFAEIMARHRQRVADHAYRMLGDNSAAEDVAQQVFIQAWRAAGRYRPEAQLITWLLHIARNLVLNEIRRRQRKPAQSLDAENLPGHFSAAPESDRPDHQAAGAETAAAIEAAIATLPENQRTALLLVRHENLSYEEIAGVMKTTVSSVKSLVFRARTHLRRKLARFLDDGAAV